jgi:hypothetical protein
LLDLVRDLFRGDGQQVFFIRRDALVPPVEVKEEEREV